METQDDGCKTLRLSVLKAVGLARKDIFGASDPYVVISIGNISGDMDTAYARHPHRNYVTYEYLKKNVKRTSVKKKTLSPVWNETFELSIPPGAGLIILDMFNENKITRDDFLGRAVIDLSQIQSGKHLKTVKQLFQRSEKSNVSGSLYLIYGFLPLTYIILNNSRTAQNESHNSAEASAPPLHLDTDPVLEDIRTEYSESFAPLEFRVNISLPGDPQFNVVPLPPGWSKRTSPGGRLYFLDHTTNTTTWIDPRNGEPSVIPGENYENNQTFRSLPIGWEERITKDGSVFYVDHKNKITSCLYPRISPSSEQDKVLQLSRNYKQKYASFKASIKELRQSNSKLRIEVGRTTVFHDSYRAIMLEGSIDNLHSTLWIKFDGEAGLDYGGLAKEWFSLVSKEICNPYYGLFEYSASDNYTLQINPNSELCIDDHLSYFEFVGRIAGLAVLNLRLLDGFFIRPFYKMLLGRPILLSDVEQIDAEYYNSLLWIKENDPSCLELNFECQTDVFGASETTELKPGGKHISVKEENKMEYIDLVIQWRFNSRIRRQMQSVIRGFNDVIPHKFIKVFDAGELEVLLSGIGFIDTTDWKKNTLYKGGYHENHQIIAWFWNLVESLGEEMRSRLLQFTTGTSRVPLLGFKELQGSDGPRLFTIEKLGAPDCLPRAHTCFNRIDLPEYRSFVELREKVVMAVEESCGFDLE